MKEKCKSTIEIIYFLAFLAFLAGFLAFFSWLFSGFFLAFLAGFLAAFLAFLGAAFLLEAAFFLAAAFLAGFLAAFFFFGAFFFLGAFFLAAFLAAALAFFLAAEALALAAFFTLADSSGEILNEPARPTPAGLTIFLSAMSFFKAFLTARSLTLTPALFFLMRSMSFLAERPFLDGTAMRVLIIIAAAVGAFGLAFGLLGFLAFLTGAFLTGDFLAAGAGAATSCIGVSTSIVLFEIFFVLLKCPC